MSGVDVADLPPPSWDAPGFALFGQPWRDVLQAAFGVRFGYCTRDGAASAMAVLFARGPFRLAYADFPNGVAYHDAAVVDALAQWARAHGAAALRLALPAGACAPARARSVAVLPTTRIDDLPGWSEKHHDKSSRSANRARRTTLVLRDAVDADAMFVADCYRLTLRQHRGSARYTPAYFSALIAGSNREPGLRCRIADVDGRAAAFYVSARQGDTTFYLHGGSTETGRAAYASDLLTLDAVRRAREAGCARYDFLQSPPDQPGLVRYKEAWGGVTRQELVYDKVLAPLRYASLRAALRGVGVATRVLERVRTGFGAQGPQS